MKTNGNDDGKTNGSGGAGAGEIDFEVKVGFARMLQGGVIMDVTTAEEARIAEDAGAVAVMALERVPADIRKEGGVARMASVDRIVSIQETVSIPTMAKVRIGHFQEAQVLEELKVDFIDESEVLTPADSEHHIDKHLFRAPFVCGARNLGEALRRIAEGAALIRTKGEAGTGDVSEAVRHLRLIRAEMGALKAAPREEVLAHAKRLAAPYDLVLGVWQEGRLPVPNFAAGGVATPADAALVMSLGAESVFVGSGIFKSEDPARTGAAIVKATARYAEPGILVEACRETGGAMKGMAVEQVPPEAQLQTRGW
ncbi:MAG: pyridoxal 5'-phosphate synthase lyase subunit PdxS [bacterium]|nr:pyridoxal 5'-phosphate synthase lyase subunit PdxS [bacterium]